MSVVADIDAVLSEGRLVELDTILETVFEGACDQSHIHTGQIYSPGEYIVIMDESCLPRHDAFLSWHSHPAYWMQDADEWNRAELYEMLDKPQPEIRAYAIHVLETIETGCERLPWVVFVYMWDEGWEEVDKYRDDRR